MKHWFQWKTWELFLLTFLVAVCALTWSALPDYAVTASILSLWIATVFRLRIPDSTRTFAIHISIVTLLVICSINPCVSGVAGWEVAPFYSVNGAFCGCMISGLLFFGMKLFSIAKPPMASLRKHVRGRSCRENPAAIEYYAKSEEVASYQDIIAFRMRGAENGDLTP